MKDNMSRLASALSAITLTGGFISVRADSSHLHEELNNLSHTKLEQRAAAIKSELTRLAHFTPRGGIGTIGYRSQEVTKQPDRQRVGAESSWPREYRH